MCWDCVVNQIVQQDNLLLFEFTREQIVKNVLLGSDRNRVEVQSRTREAIRFKFSWSAVESLSIEWDRKLVAIYFSTETRRLMGLISVDSWTFVQKRDDEKDVGLMIAASKISFLKLLRWGSSTRECQFHLTENFYYILHRVSVIRV